jgi:hypothetical protein
MACRACTFQTMIPMPSLLPLATRARSGGRPTLIEIESYRFEGHFVGDPETYRPKGEIDGLIARDPVKALMDFPQRIHRGFAGL